MLKENGTVVETGGNIAVVKLRASDCCTGCDAKSLCQMGQSGERILEVKNNLEARVGDEVVISVKTRYALGSLFTLFGLPITLGVAGVLFGMYFNSNIWSAILGLSGVGAGLVIAKIIDRVWARNRIILPEIIEIKR